MLAQEPPSPPHTLHTHLPAGKLPKEDAKTGRAYLSNVCVAQAARRRGIAEHLMMHAEAEARELGITQLYVHVVSGAGGVCFQRSGHLFKDV